MFHRRHAGHMRLRINKSLRKSHLNLKFCTVGSFHILTDIKSLARSILSSF